MTQEPQVPSRTIAEALAQRESRQMDALETLIEQAMTAVGAESTGKPIDVIEKMLADRLRPHLPVDSKSNKAWLRERAKLIADAG